MQSTGGDNHRIQDYQLDGYPALAGLRLTADDLVELAHQGFVCKERRGDRTYCKLRFRRGGKQIVRYIGSHESAAIVKKELSVLQAASKTMRDLTAKVKMANKLLREAKRAVEPALKANGFVFHGLAIRQPRRKSM